MEQLTEAVTDIMREMVEDGTVHALINKHLEKTVESLIEDALRSYSGFGKQLKAHIENSLAIDFSNVTLQEHNHTMLKMVEAAMGRYLAESAQEKLYTEINEIFSPPPEKITLQQLVDDFKEDSEEGHDRGDSDYCGLVISESSGGYIYVGLNPSDMKDCHRGDCVALEPIDSVRDCEIQLHFNRQEVEGGGPGEELRLRWVSFGGYREESTKNFMPTLLHGTARRLFQMYCAGTGVVLNHGMDAGDYSTEYNTPACRC